MTNNFENILGTSNESFTIGNDGVSIYQGTTPPPSGSYNLGDLYLQCGPSSSSQTVWVYTNNGWTNILNATQDSVNLFSSLVGVPLPWPTNNVPQGFILHDGSKFDTNEYPLLAQRYPNGTITDLRGYFIRGLDTTGNVDGIANRALLSIEDGTRFIIDGTHATVTGLYSNSGTPIGLDIQGDPVSSYPSPIYGGYVPSNSSFTLPFTSGSPGVPSVGTTRPKNIAYNYISFTGKSLPNASLSLYENNAIDFKNTLTLETTDTSPISSNNSSQIPNKNWVNSNYLPLKGGTLSGDIVLSGIKNQDDNIYSPTLYFEAGNSLVNIELVGTNTEPQLKLGLWSGDKSHDFWTFDHKTHSLLSPANNPYSEIIGFSPSNRIVTQVFQTTVIGNSTIVYPQAFAPNCRPKVFINGQKSDVALQPMYMPFHVADASNTGVFVTPWGIWPAASTTWHNDQTSTQVTVMAVGFM